MGLESDEALVDLLSRLFWLCSKHLWMRSSIAVLIPVHQCLGRIFCRFYLYKNILHWRGYRDRLARFLEPISCSCFNISVIQGADFHLERFHKFSKIRLLILTFIGLQVIDSLRIRLVFIKIIFLKLSMLSDVYCDGRCTANYNSHRFSD